MSQVVFAAKKRTNAGSAASRQMRRSGRVPAVIYGHSGEAIAIDLDAAEFVAGIKGISESTIVKVAIDGQARDAFVKDTQRNILDGQILHVDFYEVEGNTVLRARVPLLIQGNPIGVRDGGVLETPLRDIEVECLPKDLPERIKVDISNLRTNQSIHARDLVLGDGVRLLSGADRVVALVKFAKEEVSAPATEEEATPAPGAAAAPVAGAAPGGSGKE
ncbi:MAG: 50S ribosomal protein L25 [Treponema sp.]|jgi:large subunit ribosomal protein L25|nr:50S ribosomal protein L25 [Treponema sp.]